MNSEEKDKYRRGVVGLSIFLFGLLSIFFYLLYSNYKYEHYGELAMGSIMDKSDISGSDNNGYTIRYRANKTDQEIYFQSLEDYRQGDSVLIYYLPDDPKEIQFADAPRNDFGVVVLGVLIFVFGLIFILLLRFPETMVGYFDSVFR
jgi:hypothetical protein